MRRALFALLMLIPAVATAAPTGADYTGDADAFFCVRDGKFYISESLYLSQCDLTTDALATDGSIKYIDSVGGSDSNAGTFAAPWQTLAKCGGLADGTDCYLKDGSVFADQRLDITWSGSAENPVVVGCYVDDSGTPRESAECEWSMDGKLSSACIAAGNCNMNDDSLGNFNTGLIDISGNYVTVQDGIVEYHVGRGLSGKGTGATQGDHVTVLRMLIRYTGAQATVFGNDMTNFVLRDTVAHDIGWCYAGGYTVANTNCDPNKAGWGGGFVLQTSIECNCLTEGNLIYRHYGEGYNVGRVTRAVWRGNVQANGRRAAYYIDYGNYILMENNISTGNPANGNQFPNGYTGGGDAGFAIALEDAFAPTAYGQNAAGTSNLVRNHIVIGQEVCMRTGVEAGVWSTYGLQLGVDIVGMTCLGAHVTPININAGGGQSGGIGQITIANSIIYAPTATASTNTTLPCRTVNAGATTFLNNLWDRDPTAGCSGATAANGNIVGDPLLSLSNTAAQAADYTTVPSVSLLKPGVGSPARGVGTNYARTEVAWLAPSQWSIDTELTSFPGSDCGSQWYSQKQPVDFNCKPWSFFLGAVKPD